MTHRAEAEELPLRRLRRWWPASRLHVQHCGDLQSSTAWARNLICAPRSRRSQRPSDQSDRRADAMAQHRVGRACSCRLIGLTPPTMEENLSGRSITPALGSGLRKHTRCIVRQASVDPRGSAVDRSPGEERLRRRPMPVVSVTALWTLRNRIAPKILSHSAKEQLPSPDTYLASGLARGTPDQKAEYDRQSTKQGDWWNKRLHWIAKRIGATTESIIAPAFAFGTIRVKPKVDRFVILIASSFIKMKKPKPAAVGE
jgi:hypothetical protein